MSDWIACPGCGARCELPTRQCQRCSRWFPWQAVDELKATHKRNGLEVLARDVHGLSIPGDKRSKPYLATRIALALE